MSTLLLRKKKSAVRSLLLLISKIIRRRRGDSGPSLIDRMSAQAERFGAEKIYDTIVDMQLEGDVKKTDW